MVGVFEGTIEKIVVLAVFLPVLAGQSGNTGCQALAVTLRGMTLGELRPDRIKLLVGKEAWLGFLNGSLVGVMQHWHVHLRHAAENPSVAPAPRNDRVRGDDHKLRAQRVSGPSFHLC